MKNDPFVETMVHKIAFATPFSANVANTRRALSMVQKDLAKKIGTSKTTITNWEQGYSTPTLSTFVRLCVALKTTPDKLLGAQEWLV